MKRWGHDVTTVTIILQLSKRTKSFGTVGLAPCARVRTGNWYEFSNINVDGTVITLDAGYWRTFRQNKED